MRLICPKCEAHYDLEPGLIPPEGREVECSACGHIWFQRARAPLRTPQPVRPGKPVPASVPATTSDLDFGAFEADEGDALPAAGDAEDSSPPPVAPAPRRKLNESLLAVLREEAAREADARRAEAARYEIQDDLGLPEPAPAANLPMVPHTGTDLALPMVADPALFTKPEALPDPAELVEGFAAAPAPVEADLGPADISHLPAGKRARRWSGLWLALLLWLIAAGVYLAGPDLAARWPEAEPALRSYSAAIDGAREMLAALLAQIRAALAGG